MQCQSSYQHIFTAPIKHVDLRCCLLKQYDLLLSQRPSKNLGLCSKCNAAAGDYKLEVELPPDALSTEVRFRVWVFHLSPFATITSSQKVMLRIILSYCIPCVALSEYIFRVRKVNTAEGGLTEGKRFGKWFNAG